MPTYRHEVRGGLQDGEQYSWSLHSTKASSATLAAAHTAFEACFDIIWNTGASGAGILGSFAESVSVVELVSTELSDATGKNVAQVTSDRIDTGTASGETLPQEVAVCVSLRTNLPTRAGRGRFFLPPTALTTCAAGRLAHSDRNGMSQCVAEGLRSMQLAGYPVVIYHRASRTTTPVVSVDVGDVFDAMRSRRDKLHESRFSTNV